jgi:hypothetical protein
MKNPFISREFDYKKYNSKKIGSHLVEFCNLLAGFHAVAETGS